MAQSLQWGAVVGLLSLIALQSQGQDVTQQPFDEVCATFIQNGETLTQEEFFNFIVTEMDNYFPDPTPRLLEELMMMADTDEDFVVNCTELRAFINHQHSLF